MEERGKRKNWATIITIVLIINHYQKNHHHQKVSLRVLL